MQPYRRTERKFLTVSTVASAVAITALSTSTKLAKTKGQPTERTTKGFVVKSGKGRFDETTRIGGTSPNDIKVSSKDTDGNLTAFEYKGREKSGPPLHINLNQDEIFYVIQGDHLFEVGGEQQMLSAGRHFSACQRNYLLRIRQQLHQSHCHPKPAFSAHPNLARGAGSARRT